MHSFEVQSNESVCRKKVRLGLKQVNIKNIYQHAGKFDDQQNLKDIIDAAILSTPEGITDNSPNVHMTSKPV